jgi:hypothetical protein
MKTWEVTSGAETFTGVGDNLLELVNALLEYVTEDTASIQLSVEFSEESGFEGLITLIT